MKKFVLSVLVCISALAGWNSMQASTTQSQVSATTSDYCPSGYICEATNCSAYVYGRPYIEQIKGISVYRNDKNDVIANVPGHGNLRCYWDSHSNGWTFTANNLTYTIKGYSRK